MIIQYLQPPFLQNGMEYKSPYMAALTDARAATGRKVSDGTIEDASKLGNWAGTLAYMVLIEHIGIYLSKTVGASTESRAFTRALADFTTLNHPERMALYALRCAFAHQYSLINVGQGNQVDAVLLHHQFVVHRDETLITFPATPWNCVRGPATEGLITQVSVKKIGDLVEGMHTQLLAMVGAGQLVVRPGQQLIYITYAAAPAPFPSVSGRTMC
jgi:hypothetical protein